MKKPEKWMPYKKIENQIRLNSYNLGDIQTAHLRWN